MKSDEKIFRQMKQNSARVVHPTRRDFVKYHEKDSADFPCDEFLEIPYKESAPPAAHGPFTKGPQESSKLLSKDHWGRERIDDAIESITMGPLPYWYNGEISVVRVQGFA